MGRQRQGDEIQKEIHEGEMEGGRDAEIGGRWGRQRQGEARGQPGDGDREETEVGKRDEVRMGRDHETGQTGNRPTEMGSKWESRERERAREIAREMPTIERQSRRERDRNKERDGRSGTEGLRVRDEEMRWRDKTE